jgi:Peptidase family M23
MSGWRARMVAVALGAAVLCVPAVAEAQMKLTVTPAEAPVGGTVKVKVKGAVTAACRLSVRHGKAVLLRRPVGRRFGLRLRPRLGRGVRSVRVRCGSRAATAELRIVDPHSALRDLPFDTALNDMLFVDAAVGGGGFSTRAPFRNGEVHRITQGPGGAYSHSNRWNRYAVDIAAGVGTELRAGFSGVVVAATGGCASGLRNGQPISRGCNSGYGNFVLLKHVDGTCALHGHLQTITVAAGQQIARYTRIGTVGLSGSTWGPHLHYDRRDCATRISLPWGFDENRAPREGQHLVSRNEPPPTPSTDPPPSAPTPPPSSPAPSPAPGPGPAPTRRVITVDNRVTNGMGMREDPTPARLNTRPWVRCSTRGCAIGGTERGTGGTYDAAVCQTQGERTTNGHDGSTADDANPALFTSTRYYGVRLTNGTFGYVSEVWIRAADRGGLGLPAC